MRITLWSDFVCPFCFIGQSRLSQALEGFEHAGEVDVEYKSFILSPQAQYVPGEDYYHAFAKWKGISLEEARGMLRRVRELGLRAGVDINYDLAKEANTYDAHRVLQYAKELGRGGAYVRRAYRAFFTEGEVLSDWETLLRLAGEAGMEEGKVRDMLEKGGYAEGVARDLAESRAMGVASVPFFVFNNRYAMSGAQPAEEFKKILKKSWREAAAQA